VSGADEVEDLDKKSDLEAVRTSQSTKPEMYRRLLFKKEQSNKESVNGALGNGTRRKDRGKRW
jgi:hypothetical protein